MAGLLASAVDLVRSYTGSLVWRPLVKQSRKAIISLLQQIEVGQITLYEKDGIETVCGQAVVDEEIKKLVTGIHVRREAFWLRLALFADMGFAESYMLGEIECSDLTAFFRIFILNRDCLMNATTWTSSISAAVNGFLRSTNTMSNALLNISNHYDISNEMFEAFLSRDMTYSCPIWSSESLQKEKPGEESLEAAQMRKLDRFIDNAKIKETDHVLEIGTGWASFAIRAVQRVGCRITSLTLSREQKELADERIKAAGLTEMIEVLLCDYRALPMPKEGPYDKIVSIEMLEAVGREFLQTYFECIHKLLKPKGGIAVFQCITMPEARYEAYSKGEDFIRKYIFPGGHLPTVTQLVESINKGTGGQLIVDSIENIGPHYAKTLRIWKDDFMNNFQHRIRPALLAEHAGMTEQDTELFKRKWEYYFTYCEAGFNTKTLGDVIITTSREGALEMLEDIPL